MPNPDVGAVRRTKKRVEGIKFLSFLQGHEPNDKIPFMSIYFLKAPASIYP